MSPNTAHSPPTHAPGACTQPASLSLPPRSLLLMRAAASLANASRATSGCLRRAVQGCSSHHQHQQHRSLLSLCRPAQQLPAQNSMAPRLRSSAASAGGSGGAAAAAGHEQQEQQQQHKHTNRLAQEQSPYLLQHAHNPVNWYPWGEEAFAAARAQDKPVFLSVGYATCHWCHVMEGESFESEESAALLNDHFIAVKVDREERPDVDRVYMTFVQATTGGGGWPMSVWLTPELKAFYGGTYYPSQDRYSMPSFNTVLRRIAQLWDTKRDDLEEQAASVMQQLAELTAPEARDASAAGGAPSAAVLAGGVASCAASLAKTFDSQRGGFGKAPKFPRPSEINLLLRAATSQPPAAAAAAAATPSTSSKAKAPPSPALLTSMALASLQAMAAGGMYDQLGGGFHRYSVDEFWHVPHFEKMLYDNPQLVLTYLDAFRLTLASSRQQPAAAAAAAAADAGAGLAGALAAAAPAPAGDAAAGSSSPGGLSDGGGGGGLAGPRVFAAVARGVLDYLRRDMTHPEGGLFSAEDADSLDPVVNKKLEGSFYAWTDEEVRAVLADEPHAAELFCEVYGVQEGGNCTRSPRSDPHDEFGGKNVLAEFVRLDASKVAAAAGLSPEEAAALLGRARQKLHAVRAQRPRPALDDKIVTAWNGQGISAFALAARTLPAEQPPPPPCFPVDGCEPGAYMQAALGVAEFVRRHLWDAGRKRLRRAFCKAPSSVEGYSDDYALLIQGLLDLYEAGGGLQWLQWALELQETLDALFWDPAGGYFQTSGNDASVLLRLKEDYDGAEPAASSIAAANLLRLAALLPDTAGAASSSSGSLSYGARADAVLAAFSTRLQQAAIAMPQMAVAGWLKTKAPLRQVIITGSTANPATIALLNAAHAAWAPDKALILIDPADPEAAAWWQARNPQAWAMVSAHMAKTEAVAPTAFVCQNFTCQAPTTSADRLYELLTRTGSSGGGVPLTPVQL